MRQSSAAWSSNKVFSGNVARWMHLGNESQLKREQQMTRIFIDTHPQSEIYRNIEEMELQRKATTIQSGHQDTRKFRRNIRLCISFLASFHIDSGSSFSYIGEAAKLKISISDETKLVMVVVIRWNLLEFIGNSLGCSFPRCTWIAVHHNERCTNEWMNITNEQPINPKIAEPHWWNQRLISQLIVVILSVFINWNNE